MSEKLKPCPFCGGEVELVKQKSDNFEFVLVSCKNCDATIGIGGSDNEQKVTEDWNKRHNSWHTGTPTEGGLYFVYEKYVGYAKRDLPTNISKKELEDAFYNVIAWQKIELFEASN